METEIFKPIKGYEGYYEVSNLGRIKSLAKEWSVGRKGDTILKAGKRKTGYDFVVLCVNKVKVYASIHRLVAFHFCNNPNGYNVVNHINCDTSDNRAENLEWTTYTGNAVHGFTRGRRIGIKGVRHHKAKLGEDDVRAIKELCKQGVNQRLIAEKFGVKKVQISRINTGSRWSHIS